MKSFIKYNVFLSVHQEVCKSHLYVSTKQKSQSLARMISSPFIRKWTFSQDKIQRIYVGLITITRVVRSSLQAIHNALPELMRWRRVGITVNRIIKNIFFNSIVWVNTCLSFQNENNTLPFLLDYEGTPIIVKLLTQQYCQENCTFILSFLGPQNSTHTHTYWPRNSVTLHYINYWVQMEKIP